MPSKPIEDWKTLLRARLREALLAREKHAVTVLRETLAALDNAEAPPAETASRAENSPFVGSLAGLGAGDIARLELAPEAVSALLARELRERREAAQAYAQLGRTEEARVLDLQADVLVDLGVEAP